MVSSQVSSIVVWGQTALWDQELEQNMVSRKRMQAHMAHIHYATEQKEHNLSMSYCRSSKNGSMQAKISNYELLQFTAISNDILSPHAPI